jgi:hypothetical protein
MLSVNARDAITKRISTTPLSPDGNLIFHHQSILVSTMQRRKNIINFHISKREIHLPIIFDVSIVNKRALGK